MNGHVLVTGASGHLGYNLTQLLIASGYRVRAGVRSREDRARNAPLERLGAELVETDMLRPDTLASACAGMHGVFHCAAVVRFWAKDPQREIIDPTVQGATAIVDAAASTGVRRLVFTSSMAAVGIAGPRSRPLTEADWNAKPLTAYARAKTEAERAASQLAQSRGLDMVVVNPATIIGPGVFRHTPITLLFELLLRRRVPFLLPADASYVDARDLAQTMRCAYQKPEARGRYIVSAGFVAMHDLARMVALAEPRLRVPRRRFPARLLPLLVAGDWISAALLRTERQLTSDMIAEFADAEMHCSAVRAIQDLGFRPRPLTESVADTVHWVRRQFLDTPAVSQRGAAREGRHPDALTAGP
jgi:dihydroflavonol-4-reductase